MMEIFYAKIIAKRYFPNPIHLLVDSLIRTNEISDTLGTAPQMAIVCGHYVAIIMSGTTMQKQTRKNVSI